MQGLAGRAASLHYNRHLHLQGGESMHACFSGKRKSSPRGGKAGALQCGKRCKTEREKRRPASGKLGFSTKRAKMKLEYDHPAH